MPLEGLMKTEFLTAALNSLLIAALTAAAPKLGLSEGMLLTAAGLLTGSSVAYGTQRTMAKIKAPEAPSGGA